MTVAEIVALVSVCIAALTLLLNLSRDRRGAVSETQAIRDKLDYIADTTRDTREDVRNLDRKLDDHARRLDRLESKET